MGKRTQKLLVYLDQNFLSDMSKVEDNARLQEFKEIYLLLHRGFMDEKLVVPGSSLHDIESSLDTRLKDGIVSCQGRMGQVRLKRPEEIWNNQTFAAFHRFMGGNPSDPLRPEVAFSDYPDQRVQRFGVTVDWNLETYSFRQNRHVLANNLEKLRRQLLLDKVTYHQQLKVERQAQRDQFLQTYCCFCGQTSEEETKKLIAFTESKEFAEIPVLRIEAHLFASILTRKPTRQVKPSDTTDIDALSAYAPYMDVVCTDAFMADQIQSYAKEYGIALFHARSSSLRKLKMFLEQYLSSKPPIRQPTITAFVLPPKERRNESAQFFRELGSALRAMGINEYGEVYAFDDGAMPKYELSMLPGKPVPFYGLQDVTRIELPAGATENVIVDICRQHCRSDHFVLIHEYKDIARTFMLEAAMCAEGNLDSVYGYRIFKKRP